MADVAQLVRAPGCGSGGRGFETHHSPQNVKSTYTGRFFINKHKHLNNHIYKKS